MEKPTETQTTPFHSLHKNLSSLQTNFTNFLKNIQPKIPFPETPHNFAKISNQPLDLNKTNPITNSSAVKKTPLSAEAIDERLAGVPVYALTNSSQEFVLVSGTNTNKNIGLFCFSESDAESLLKKLESADPFGSSGSQIVPVALSKVVQLKVDGVALRLIPEASQVQNALKERERAGVRDQSFPGVPVFQSKSLILRSENKRYRPVFFRKEDLEKSLSRASRDQKQLNPMLRGDIQVAVLEDIIQGMKDSSTPSWDDVVFIPPGFDVSTDASQA